MTSTSILLVEPKDELAQSIIKVLEPSGYRVTHVRTGRSALLEPSTANIIGDRNRIVSCLRKIRFRSGVAIRP